jgi:hypothetical protein
MINSELLALSALQSEYPKHIITHSSAYQDMKWHYDFIITNPITSIKKYVESKYKEEGLGEFMWYEAANKYGDRGWGYGCADWLLHNIPNGWIMLGMDNLRRSVHTQVIKNGGLTIFTDKEKVGNFQAYSRTKWGNSDILIKLPYEFVFSLPHKLIY